MGRAGLQQSEQAGAVMRSQGWGRQRQAGEVERRKSMFFSLHKLRLQVKLSKGQSCQNQNDFSALSQSLCKYVL